MQPNHVTPPTPDELATKVVNPLIESARAELAKVDVSKFSTDRLKEENTRLLAHVADLEAERDRLREVMQIVSAKLRRMVHRPTNGRICRRPGRGPDRPRGGESVMRRLLCWMFGHRRETVLMTQTTDSVLYPFPRMSYVVWSRCRRCGR